jgi:hypothetical protein
VGGHVLALVLNRAIQFLMEQEARRFANRLGFVCPYVWGDSLFGRVCICVDVYTVHIDSFLSECTTGMSEKTIDGDVNSVK